MVGNCEIRRFKPDDLPQLHAIRKAAYEPVFQSFRDLVGKAIAPIAFASAEQEQGDYLDLICSQDSPHEVYVIERAGVIAGFVGIKLDGESGVGEIDLNAVHPDHQGRGIGSWMYAFALSCMKEAGMKIATVGTGGDVSHAPARRAYEKAGFGPSIPNVYYYKAL